jgi:hypothetical protein
VQSLFILSTERLLNSNSSPQRRYTSGASRVYLDDDSRREFSIEVLELIVSHAPPVVTNGDLSIRPKVGRDFVFGIFLLGPQAIQGQKLHGISNANSRNDLCISPATQASEIISHGFGKSSALHSWHYCPLERMNRAGLCRQGTWVPKKPFEPTKFSAPRPALRSTMGPFNWPMTASTLHRDNLWLAGETIRF